LCEQLERQKRTFDLAMTASHMGTWRYTLGDNICEYDENAQRLYGLTEARSLHDAGGYPPSSILTTWNRPTGASPPRSILGAMGDTASNTGSGSSMAAGGG
jgi:hypothetical protein